MQTNKLIWKWLDIVVMVLMGFLIMDRFDIRVAVPLLIWKWLDGFEGLLIMD